MNVCLLVALNQFLRRIDNQTRDVVLCGRYKNFRTLVTPQPAQLTSLALDGSGEVVVAGAMDPFEVRKPHQDFLV